MVQGYYTLQEAASFLGITTEELKQMAQKGQIRSFQDRGTLRFRIQDIQELARTRGGSSDPELVLGDASLPPPKSSASPSSAGRKAPKTPNKQQAVPDVFEFEFDNENVDLAGDLIAPASNAKSRGGSKGKKAPTPPHEPKGSDSDVRLVSDGSDVSFSLAKDSDIKLADSAIKGTGDPAKPKTSMQASSGKRSSQVSLGSGVQQPTGKTGLSSRQQISPKPGSGPQPVDSGVRLVPMDSDSDVKILTQSDEVSLGGILPPAHADSNVRLDRIQMSPVDSGEGNMMQTEEINLDEELRKQEESGQGHPPAKVKAKSKLNVPKQSPFELSDSEMRMPSELLGDAGPKTPTSRHLDSSDSSDFDMLPAGGDNLLLGKDDSDDFSLELPEDHEHVLQPPAAGLTGSTSGISLSNPVDAGISLEEHGDAHAADFDLSLEVEDTPRPAASSPVDDAESDFQLQVSDTPRPVESHPAVDSESEFELSLSSDTEPTAPPEGQESEIDLSLDLDTEAPAATHEDSEFELNLDNSDEAENAAKPDSDSEFELTLDDSGNIASMEDEDSAPQVKSKKSADEEQDIFETDFEVPALDESDSGTMTSSELESSDFDLALDDSELAPEEESGSQVVALDEEDAETLVDSEDAAVVDDLDVEEESSDFGDLDQDVQVDSEEEVEAEGETAEAGPRKTVIKEKLLPPAPWGVMPVVFMLPCVVIMFLVGILGYEMMQSTANMRAPGPLTLAIADMLNQPIALKK